MHRRCFLLFISAVLSTFSLFAQEEAGWLSLQRLSLTASGGYSYRPWNKLNESLKIAQDAINYGTDFTSPSGSAEKIIGDISGRAALSYRVFSGLSLGVVGSTTATSSHTDLEIQWGRRLQDYRLTVWGYGVGAEYRLNIGENYELSASISVEHVRATLNFHYNLDYVSFGERYDAKLSDTRNELRTGIHLARRITQHVTILCGVEYRHMAFPNLQGRASYTQVNGPSEPPYVEQFDSKLIERGGYFGIDAHGIGSAERLGWLAMRVPPQNAFNPDTPSQPATLNLSAFGLSLGVCIEF